MKYWFGVLTVVVVVHAVQAGEPLSVEVRETAGIQRFSYPVEGRFRAPEGASRASHFRLHDGQRPLRAQFSLLEEARSAQSALWAVNFNIDLLPNQFRTLTLEAADDFPPPDPVVRGLTVDRADGKVHVKHPTLEFVVSEDLRGLLDAVRIADEDWLMEGSPGLTLHLRDGQAVPWIARLATGQDASLRVVKSGPLSVTLESAAAEMSIDGKTIRAVARLDFPLGKSWLRVDWHVDDPSDVLAGLSGQLQLRLNPTAKQPVVADVGANGWTYAALFGEDKIVFRAGSNTTSSIAQPPEPAWEVRRVLSGRDTPYVAPAEHGFSERPQGWAHLMDGSRCAAIAFDRFAECARDTIELSAGGHVRLRREFAASTPAGDNHQKQLTFWLHFVGVPPQWGAATSPQSMQAPPSVRIVEADQR